MHTYMQCSKPKNTYSMYIVLREHSQLIKHVMSEKPAPCPAEPKLAGTLPLLLPPVASSACAPFPFPRLYDLEKQRKSHVESLEIPGAFLVCCFFNSCGIPRAPILPFFRAPMDPQGPYPCLFWAPWQKPKYST